MAHVRPTVYMPETEAQKERLCWWRKNKTRRPKWSYTHIERRRTAKLRRQPMRDQCSSARSRIKKFDNSRRWKSVRSNVWTFVRLYNTPVVAIRVSLPHSHRPLKFSPCSLSLSFGASRSPSWPVWVLVSVLSMTEKCKKNISLLERSIVRIRTLERRRRVRSSIPNGRARDL